MSHRRDTAAGTLGAPATTMPRTTCLDDRSPPWYRRQTRTQTCRPRCLAALLLAWAASCGGGGSQRLDSADSADNGDKSAADAGPVGNAGPTVRSASLAVAPGGAGLAVLPMAGCVGAEYYGEVNVGNDALSLILDSGSTTLAVSSSLCRRCETRRSYDGDTGTNLGGGASSAYGDGSSWRGVLVRDEVSMGPLTAPATPQVTVNFAAIVDEQNFFFADPTCAQGSTVANEGLLGLGPDTLLEPGSTSFLSALAATGRLAHDAFAVQTCEVGGKLMLGGYASDAVAEDPFYVPMVASGGYAAYYSVALAGMALGGRAAGLSASRLGAAIVDTGTTVNTLPPAPYQALLAGLGKNTGFTDNFDVGSYQQGKCMVAARASSREAVDAALPKWQLFFVQAGGARATLELDATRSYLAPVVGASGTTYYCPTVLGVDASEPTILGNAMMRQHVVIFDRANRRIGFATPAGCPDTITFAEET